MHTVTVLVCLGSYNKIPYTRCLINNINFFLIVLQTGRVKMLADLASGEGPFSNLKDRLLPRRCVLTWRKGKGVSGVSFTRVLILFMMALL